MQYYPHAGIQVTQRIDETLIDFDSSGDSKASRIRMIITMLSGRVGMYCQKLSPDFLAILAPVNI